MPTVIAEGVAAGCAWRLEAWRPAQERRRVYFAVRRPGRESDAFDAVTLDDQPITARFSPDPDNAGSVLYCAVADEVEAVVVEPVRPQRRGPMRPAILSPQGLGRSVVVAFDDPVELVTVRAEPRERFSTPETVAWNPGFDRPRRGDGDEPAGAREPRRPRPSNGGAVADRSA